MRRMTKVLAGAAALTFGMASSALAEGLRVATYGGSAGEAYKKCVLDPFSAKTGIAISTDIGVSSVTLSKLQQQRDKPTLDVAWLNNGVSEVAYNDGLLDAIPETLPNLKTMSKVGVYKGKQGEIYAFTTGFYGLGMAYNTEEVKEAPTSWFDLWKPDYAGRVVISSMADSEGVLFFIRIAELLGGGVDNMQPAVDKLKQLDVAAYSDNNGTTENLFVTGEAIIGVHDVGSVGVLKQKGFPIAFTVPKEGPLAGDMRIHLVRNAPNKEAALQLLDYAISPEAGKCIAETANYGPPQTNLELPPELQELMPWGVGRTVDDLKLFDFNAINANRDRIIELFNREVAGR